MNSTWLITSELANQRARKVLFTCVVYTNGCYSIASRATKLNSVYVSVLQISIVLADGASKWLPPEFSSFFARAALVSAGKNIIFRYNNGYKQTLSPLVAKRRQFSDLFSWARVLMRQKKRKKRKWKLGINAVTIRFTVRG